MSFVYVDTCFLTNTFVVQDSLNFYFQLLKSENLIKVTMYSYSCYYNYDYYFIYDYDLYNIVINEYKTQALLN